jgi:hypothetical protein
MELFLFHGMAKAFAKEVFLELGLDIRSVTAANHFKRGVAGPEARKAGRLLEGEGHLFLCFADMIRRDFALQATPATAHIFQGYFHEEH